MSYNFDTLSSADFEDLSLDAVACRDGLSFERFSAGRDGGVDGRLARGKNKTGIMLQAKHYYSSTFPALLSAMKKERLNINREKPDRYILTTSVPMTPIRKQKLANVIGPKLKTQADIIGPAELNKILVDHPKIEKAHFKLWLTSSAVLERFINAEAHMFSELSFEEVRKKVKLFATNASVPLAQSILESHHVLIISGAPGVGKTSLAELLGYQYVHDGWSFIGVRSIDDALAALNKPGEKVILFDDFLGTIQLDSKTLSASENKIDKFIRKVRSSDDARFIMTSRAYILQDAKDHSDVLSDKKLDVSEYLLDVGVYTRRIRARILYNHLVYSDLSAPYISALITPEILKKIVDHKNYIPRIIDWMTQKVHLLDIKFDGYADFFIKTLDNPVEIWDRAYRKHITYCERHLLIGLFFASSWTTNLEKLESIYNRIHPKLCAAYKLSFGPSDFQSAMHVLDGGFIRITDWGVDFVNPSVRDYLKHHLKQDRTLDAIADCGVDPSWPDNVWSQVRHISKAPKYLKTRAQHYTNAGVLCTEHPLAKLDKKSGQYGSWSTSSISLSSRLYLLLRLSLAIGDDRFDSHIFHLTGLHTQEMGMMGDGAYLPELIEDLRDAGLSSLNNSSKIADAIEAQLIYCIEQHCYWPDEVESMASALDAHSGGLSDSVLDAMHDCVTTFFGDLSEIISQIDDEDEVNQLRDTVKTLGSIIHRNTDEDFDTLDERISEIQEGRVQPTRSATTQSYSGYKEYDKFNDSDLSSLFQFLK